ncbi:MAG TPA: hypothetical protein VE553_11065 [Candidatus Binatia bacterium]|jgi:hypothetical protein|nr:hypothetical protein [Candidatus Binatia bacterium]
MMTFLSALVVGGLIAARRPHNIYGWLWLGVGVGLIFLVGIPASIFSLRFRYRSATGLERAQLRWLAFASAANLCVFVVTNN